MKKIFINIFIVVLIVGVFITKKVVSASLPLSGRIIVIDVGHGGRDPGSISNGIYEKDINLAISKALERELIKNGAEVIMIRDGDYDLSKPNANMRKRSDFDNRLKIINESNANYYLSIHLNYLTDTRYYGPQVFYNKKSSKNQILAETLQNNFNKDLKTKRETKQIPNRTYMYDKIKIPGVLIECGFLSNAHERNLLTKHDYQNKLAKIITDSLISLNFH